MVGFFLMIGALIAYELGAPVIAWLTMFLGGLAWVVYRMVRPKTPKPEKWHEREKR